MIQQTETLSIRKATEENLAGVLKLFSQPDLDKDNVLFVDQAKAIFQQMQLYPQFELFVVVANQAIVGTFESVIASGIGHQGAPFCVIEDVVTSPEIQGEGVGKKMMQFAIEHAKNEGCRTITLSSNLMRTRAHQFYEDKLEFKRDGYSYLTTYFSKEASNNFIIREATEKDLRQLAFLHASTPESILKGLSNMKRYPNFIPFVLETEKRKLIGSFDFLVMHNLGHLGTPSGIVENIMIAENWRNKELEKAILNFALRRGNEAGCYKVAMSHPTLNQRHPQHCGFEVHGYRFSLT